MTLRKMTPRRMTLPKPPLARRVFEAGFRAAARMLPAVSR